MSAEILRQAVSKLRLYVSHATKGPWDVAEDGLVWPERMGDPVSGSTELEDAEYIALMHPPVALALAEWIEAHADDLGRSGDFRYCDSPGDTHRAIAVARAILREPDPVGEAGSEATPKSKIVSEGPAATSPAAGPDRVELWNGAEWVDLTPYFNPEYRIARCGDSSAHGPHVMEHGPDQPRNCPGTGRTRWAAEPTKGGTE